MRSTATARLGRLLVTGRVAVGADVQQVRSDGPGESHVAEAVAHHPGRPEVEVQHLRRRMRHARHRLAVGAHPGERLDRALRVVGTGQPHVDVRSRVGQDLRHVGVHAVHVLDRVEAAGHTPLVGADRDRHVCGVESRDRLGGTVDEVDPLDRADVAVVDDDRAVPVQQDARSARLMCACALHRPAPPERLIARPPVAALARQPARRYSGSMSGEPVHTANWGRRVLVVATVAGLVVALLVATRSRATEPSHSPEAAVAVGAEILRLAPDAPRKPPAQICGSAGLKGPSTPPAGARVIRTSSNLSNAVLNAPPGKTFWLEPGVHHAGDDEFAQLIPKDGQSFIGAPGAILDGQRINRYAFTQQATGVTIAYLTIRNFTSSRR